MKRTKFIAGALVLSMGLLGTGYAYWTDALSVNAIVGTGSFGVVITEANAIPLEKSDNSEDKEYIEGSSAEITEEGKAASLSISNMYPGARADYVVKMENLGTIPAVIESIEVDTATDMSMNQLGEQLEFVAFFDATGEEESDDMVEIKADTLSKLQVELNKLKGNRVEPNENPYLRVEVKMKNDATNEYQDKLVVPTIKINWEQHNVNK